jgi:hypothetical protein
VRLLQTITKPFVRVGVQIDKAVLQCWSNANFTLNTRTRHLLKLLWKESLQIEDVSDESIS